MTTEQFVPYEMKTSILQIVSYEHKNPCGYLENAYFEEKKYFSNLTQMLFLIDALLDTLAYPQRGTVPRTLTPAPARHVAACESAAVGTEKCLASFRLSVLFRQNASWQGSIQWIEEKSASQFRSVLELIQLLDSVLAQYDSHNAAAPE